MKKFERREIRAAILHAQSGGQALHVFLALKGMRAPSCFLRSLHWGHLFDRDERRLRELAGRLGVRKIVVEHRGTEKQHIDLCGKPLQRAIEMARAEELGRLRTAVEVANGKGERECQS